jgi:hypothetical protein
LSTQSFRKPTRLDPVFFCGERLLIEVLAGKAAEAA